MYFWRSLTMVLPDRRAMVTCGVTSVMNEGQNLTIFMYQMVYGHHFSHSIIHSTAISWFTTSSAACPEGAKFLPWMRGGSSVLSSTTAFCRMHLWSREHRSSMAMHISFIYQLPRRGLRVQAVSFPSPAQPLNLCMICEEKNPQWAWARSSSVGESTLSIEWV